jgi:transposase
LFFTSEISDKGSMSRFFSYEPDQAYLLPPNIKDVLGKGHLCFHVHRVVEALEVSHFEQAYGAEGRLAYPPRMMLKVWLYAFCLRLTSTRRLEQRVREDLGLRYLAGGLTPDHKTLSEFLRQHRRAINDVFTQVLELARRAGLVRLGHVAIDSTRVSANASRQRVLNGETGDREQRAQDRRQVRRFQQKAMEQDPEEGAGVSVDPSGQERLEQQLEQARQGLQPLPKRGRKQVSETDPDSRFLRSRKGWVLGYTAEMAVSDDHFIVATRVTQNATDNASLVPLVDEVEKQCRQRPAKVTADSGFFSGAALHECCRRGIDLYVPDPNLTHEINTGEVAGGIGRTAIRDLEHLRLREKLRSPAGRKMYQRRQAVVEPVFGVLKEQRGMGRFQRRGLAAVTTEWMLAAIAYNITRMTTAKT